MSERQEDLQERLEMSISSWISEWDDASLADLLGVLQVISYNSHTMGICEGDEYGAEE